MIGKIAIFRENEVEVIKLLRSIDIEPLRIEQRNDPKLISIILPELNDDQKRKLLETIPVELFAFRAHII